MGWKRGVPAVVLAGNGLWCQVRISASARWSAVAAKELLLHYTAPAIVTTVLTIGLLALALSVLMLFGEERMNYPATPPPLRDDSPDSLLDCLNTKSLQSLKVVLHGFELFGSVPVPIRDFARDPKRISRAI
jgi:hypothetical protein